MKIPDLTKIRATATDPQTIELIEFVDAIPDMLSKHILMAADEIHHENDLFASGMTYAARLVREFSISVFRCDRV